MDFREMHSLIPSMVTVILPSERSPFIRMVSRVFKAVRPSPLEKSAIMDTIPSGMATS